MTLKIDLQTIQSGYDRQTCWTHARPGAIPVTSPQGPRVVVTMQKLRLSGSDVFYPVNDLRTDDGGQTWIGPTPHDATLGRRQVEDGIEEGISDLTPQWHAPTGRLLATGHTIRYKDDQLAAHPRPRSTIYSIYDVNQHTWSAWRKIEGTPQSPTFFCEGAGSTQRLDLANGEILLPTYMVLTDTATGAFRFQAAATVMRCHFDGQTLRYLDHGNELTIPEGRGFTEPSMTYAAGRYWLTLRNNDAGYLTTSADGLNYDQPIRWTFDDGSDLGNYNTQQHWLAHGDELYLIYTRRGADNDHVFRHRAPLFIARVDTERLCIRRRTERILVPERGARLGNFGLTWIRDDEAWLVVSEWMQTTLPDPHDSRACERHGSNNTIHLAKLLFDEPDQPRG